MEAYQVPLEQSFPRLLEKKLQKAAKQKIEVINLGVGGYGTAQEYLSLKEEGIKYKPDLVLLAIYPYNDIRNNSYKIEKELCGQVGALEVAARPFFSFDSRGAFVMNAPDYALACQIEKKHSDKMEKKKGERSILEKILLYRMFENKKMALDAQEKDNFRRYHALLGVFYSHYDDEWNTAWTVTERLLCMTRDLAEYHGARFMMISVPAKIQVEQEYLQRAIKSGIARDTQLELDVDKPEKVLGGISARNGLEFLSMLDRFRKEYQTTGKELFYRIEDRHWNSSGHECAASGVAEYILHDELLTNPADESWFGKTGQMHKCKNCSIMNEKKERL